VVTLSGTPECTWSGNESYPSEVSAECANGDALGNGNVLFAFSGSSTFTCASACIDVPANEVDMVNFEAPIIEDEEEEAEEVYEALVEVDEAIMGCQDVTVSGEHWHDADGVQYTCNKYVSEGWCAQYGDGYAWGGHTANSACCGCGGGNEVSSTTVTIPANDVTDEHDVVIAAQDNWNYQEAAAISLEQAAAGEVAAAEAEEQVVHQTGDALPDMATEAAEEEESNCDPTWWSDGYDGCDGYSDNPSWCDSYGDYQGTDYFTANEVCSVCGCL
jgi:hypothetical protein